MINTILYTISKGSCFLKKYSWLLMDITIMGIFLLLSAKEAYKAKINQISPKTAQITSVQTGTQIKTIIFDLGGILFKTSTKAKLSFMPLILKNPSLINFDAEKELYSILDPIKAISNEPVYNKGQRLPLILSDWMSGLKTPKEIKELATTAIKNSTLLKSQKKMLYKMSELMFTPERLAQSQKLIKPMISMIKKLKEAGYQIYILSNWDEKSFQYVYDNNPKLFALCDKICISGKEKLSKPDPRLFKKLFAMHNLKPSECIFIDDELHNIAIAKKLGLKAIQHTNKNSTFEEIKHHTAA